MLTEIVLLGFQYFINLFPWALAAPATLNGGD